MIVGNHKRNKYGGGLQCDADLVPKQRKLHVSDKGRLLLALDADRWVTPMRSSSTNPDRDKKIAFEWHVLRIPAHEIGAKYGGLTPVRVRQIAKRFLDENFEQREDEQDCST